MEEWRVKRQKTEAKEGRYLLVESDDLVHFLLVLEELLQFTGAEDPVPVRA